MFRATHALHFLQNRSFGKFSFGAKNICPAEAICQKLFCQWNRNFDVVWPFSSRRMRNSWLLEKWPVSRSLMRPCAWNQEAQVSSLQQLVQVYQEKCRFCSDKLEANIRLLEHDVGGRRSRSASATDAGDCPENENDDESYAVANLKQVGVMFKTRTPCFYPQVLVLSVVVVIDICGSNATFLPRVKVKGERTNNFIIRVKVSEVLCSFAEPQWSQNRATNLDLAAV